MNNQACIKIYEHLFEQYPNIPKFANDPEESQLIRVYDLILKRFEGVYGCQPLYFVRSPAAAIVFGSLAAEVCLDNVSFCSLQNVIVAGSINGHSKIRVNHYQSAVYGQKIFANEPSQWKYAEQNDQYTNILLATLKCYGMIQNMQKGLPGMDFIIYDDFLHDDFLYWKQALALGFKNCLEVCLDKGKNFETRTKQKNINFLKKIKQFIPQIKVIDLSLSGQYGKLTHKNQNNINNYLQFPKNIDIIIAHSMTPQPKKLIQGKRHNLRKCEIKIGIQILRNQIGASCEIDSLGHLQEYLDYSLKQLMDAVEEYLPKGDLTTQKIQQVVQKPLIDILKQVPFANNVIDQNITFNPYNRIIHYLKQQQLINSLTTQNIPQKLNESFSNSLTYLNINSQQISQMIALIKDLSIGWKIIGDGWGGNLLVMCEKQKSRHIVQILQKQFYLSEKNKILLSDDLEQYVMVVGRPATCLSVLNPQNQIWF